MTACRPLPRAGRDERGQEGGIAELPEFDVLFNPFLQAGGNEETVKALAVGLPVAGAAGKRSYLHKTRSFHGQLDEFLAHMQALGIRPRLKVHGGGLAEGITQHRAAVLAGLVTAYPALGHAVAVGVGFLQIAQPQLHFDFPAHAHGSVLQGARPRQPINNGSQGDEGRHVGGKPPQGPHAGVTPARFPGFGPGKEGLKGVGKRLHGPTQECLAIARTGFVALFAQAGQVGKEAVPPPVEHFLFKGLFTGIIFIGNSNLHVFSPHGSMVP